MGISKVIKVIASLFITLLFLSQTAQAYWVSCKCYACEGPKCQSLLNPIVKKKCSNPQAHCGLEMGYEQITEVEVSTNSKDYDHVIRMLQVQCAQEGEVLLGSPEDVFYSIEKQTCIQRFVK